MAKVKYIGDQNAPETTVLMGLVAFELGKVTEVDPALETLAGKNVLEVIKGMKGFAVLDETVDDTTIKGTPAPVEKKEEPAEEAPQHDAHVKAYEEHIAEVEGDETEAVAEPVTLKKTSKKKGKR